MNLFGFEILRKKEKELDSIVSPNPQDGSTVVNTGVNAGGYYGMVMDLDGVIKNENDLIRRYREVATYSDCDSAIEDIVSEAIVYDEEDQTVTINLDDVDVSDTIKKKIRAEFDEVMKLLKFQERGHEIFRTWYVDGRIYYHILLDEKNLKQGIVELRYIDPRKIRRIKNVVKSRTSQGVEVVKEVQEYYLYNDKGITEQTTQGVKLSLDSVVYTPSGFLDANSGMMMSYLHKAIKPTNQLKMIEDSLVIYRISRAPERRIFYVDVGNLPKLKAEQYVNDIMNKFRNKIVYDATTGEVRDDRRHLSMMEDFWMPRREGGKGTEITTLPGGCFAMDTKVSLLDGRELSIKDIETELAEGKTLWTYSCDEFTGEVKPGLISWAGVTQKSAEVMKLTLDNGEEIICTPDHKFPIYGRGFVEAKDFVEGESLIPLYRKKEFISEHKKLDYEMVFDNVSKTWVYTHRLVKEFVDLPLEIFEEDYNDGYVVHHKNVNRHDNSPENLCLMSFKDHTSLHKSISFPPMMGTIAAAAKIKKEKELNSDWYQNRCKISSINSKEFWGSLSEEELAVQADKIRNSVNKFISNQTDEQKAIRVENSRKNFKLGNQKFSEKLKSDPEFALKMSNIRKESWTKERKEKSSIRQSAISRAMWADEEIGNIKRLDHKNKQEVVFNNYIMCCIVDAVKGKTTHQVTIKDVANILNENEKCLFSLKEINANKSIPNTNIDNGFTSGLVEKCVKRFGGYDSWKDFRVKESLHNHRVIKIERLAEKIEVGTLTIDAKELIHGHHTFALSCGVFTKNSNLGEIQDIEYFQQKLYRSLNVPIGRLQEQQGFSIGRAQEISRDEVKFNKFIIRLRQKFSHIFTDALRVQLIAKNIMRPEEWDLIKQDIRYNYVVDNHYAELKDNEILMGRLNALQMIEPYLGKFYSMQWVKKNVLQQTEDEIEEIQTEMDSDEEYHVSDAERTGQLAGVTQAAQQNFLQANAPQASEAPVADAPKPSGQ